MTLEQLLEEMSNRELGKGRDGTLSLQVAGRTDDTSELVVCIRSDAKQLDVHIKGNDCIVSQVTTL